MKRHNCIVRVLVAVFLLQCISGVAVAAQAKGTQLYYQSAPTSLSQAQTVWPSNTDTGWNYTVKMDDGSSFRTFGYYNNRSEAGAGLPEGEFLEIVIPNLNLKTANHGEMELSFRYFQHEYSSEINVAMVDDLQLYASTDGGKTWSKRCAVLKDSVLVGMGQTEGYECHAYDIYTTDLARLVEAGQVINALKLRPFGNHPEHYGNFRLAWMEVTGYAGKLPVRTQKPAQITVDGDVLRQVAVEQFYKQCLLPWTPSQVLETYNGATTYERTQWYLPGRLYLGPPYSRPARSTWERFFNSVDANGDLVDTYHYTNEDCEGGLDCIYTVWDGISLISPAHANSWTYILKEKNNSVRMLGVIQEKTKIFGSRNPRELLGQFTDQEVYEAYAELKLGDMLLNGHAQMVTVNPTVVRRADGTIDPYRSSVKITDTGGSIIYYYMKPDGSVVQSWTKEVDDYLAKNPTYTYLYGTSMRIDLEQTFYDCLYGKNNCYIPATMREYSDGRIPVQQLNVVTHTTADNVVEQGFYAAVQSNYRIVKQLITITDKASGKAVYTYEYYPKVSYCFDFTNRISVEAVDAKLAALPAGSYTIALDVQSGPVTRVGGTPPMNRVYQLDFTVN